MNNNLLNPAHTYKYINFLSMVYLTFLLAATVSAYKVIILGHYSAPGSTLIYPFTFFLANIFAESYGFSLAKKLIWQSVICGYIFALLLTLINILPSPDYWDHTKEYNFVLGNILRFTSAGVLGYLSGSFLNIYLFTKWKYKWNGRFFWIRNLLATSITEGVVTYFVGILTFYNLMSLNEILVLMTHAFLFKMIYGIIAIGPVGFISYLLRKAEKGTSANNIYSC